MSTCKQTKKDHCEVIGLLPAGGHASRIAPLPCSKELYPVGFRKVDNEGNLRTKVISHYLLEKMSLAGILKAYIILRSGKWDIPAYFEDGKILNMHIAYLMMNLPYGVPYTLDQAYPFIQTSNVAFGFPDIIFRTKDVFVKMIKKHLNTDAEVVLGLFPADEPHKKDMVDIGGDSRIREIVKNPIKTSLRYTWSIAVWTPHFSRFMHEYVASRLTISDRDNYDTTSEQGELTLGEVIQAAIENRMNVVGIIFHSDSCLDIGTPTNLVKAVRNLS
ncbi:MAG: dTDP-glucose pyrophosphorylase [Candidatus Kuenenia sp.]|nr:dTDP-glucose pyrophosphorylase [Candidatus Kuenenia hertensis]